MQGLIFEPHLVFFTISDVARDAQQADDFTPHVTQRIFVGAVPTVCIALPQSLDFQILKRQAAFHHMQILQVQFVGHFIRAKLLAFRRLRRKDFIGGSSAHIFFRRIAELALEAAVADGEAAFGIFGINHRWVQVENRAQQRMFLFQLQFGILAGRDIFDAEYQSIDGRFMQHIEAAGFQPHPLAVFVPGTMTREDAAFRRVAQEAQFLLMLFYVVGMDNGFRRIAFDFFRRVAKNILYRRIDVFDLVLLRCNQKHMPGCARNRLEAEIISARLNDGRQVQAQRS